MTGIIKIVKKVESYWDGEKFVSDSTKIKWYDWIEANQKMMKMVDKNVSVVTGKDFIKMQSLKINELTGKLFSATNRLQRYQLKYGPL